MLRSLTLASTTALVAFAIGAAPALAQSAGGYNWTGAYVGLNLGYGGGDFSYPYSGTTDAAGTNPVAGRLRQSSSGVLGGGQIGYNYEMPNGVLFGVETDLDDSDIGAKSSFADVDNLGNANSGDVRSRIDYLGTVRARLGKAMFDGRFVPYVTGGFAYGGVRASSNAACSACASGGPGSAGFDAGTATQTGWTAGAGAEYALSNHLSFKAEYLYADLGSRDLADDAGQFSGPGFSIYNAGVRENATANLVRVGLNYRF